MPLISVSHLKKYYSVHKRPPGFWPALRSLVRRPHETVKAVDDISFSIHESERVGFLGPNGAGKTTTLKTLSGLLHPTSGEVQVGGFFPGDRQTEFLRSIMLVTGQKQQLIWDLPPAETFDLNRAVYEIPKKQYEETLDEMITLLELKDLLRTPTRQLSLGERMKCELAAALLHRPKVLFLDEPTIGLDVTMQSTVRRFIKDYNERHGATVLLTSHYMVDVIALCPRVVLIDHGRIIYDGSLEGLIHSARQEKRVQLRLSQPVDAADLLAGGGVLISHTESQVLLRVRQDEMNAVIMRALSTLPVADLIVEDPPLEEVLADLFSRQRDHENEPPQVHE